MNISDAIAQATMRLYDSSDPVDLEAADVLANYDPIEVPAKSECPVKEGDFIFYHSDGAQESTQVGKVLKVFPEHYRQLREVRTDSEGMQVPLGVSLRTDWVWEGGKYVLPRSKP